MPQREAAALGGLGRRGGGQQVPSLGKWVLGGGENLIKWAGGGGAEMVGSPRNRHCIFLPILLGILEANSPQLILVIVT